jgi:toluene monooxygenase system ferredoxin subunit
MTTQIPQALMIAETLADTPFFGGLDEWQLERIATHCQFQQFDAGDCVYYASESALFFYVLISGTIRLAVGYGGHGANAGELLRRRDVFGWAALTPSCSCRIATATSVNVSRVLAIRGGDLIGLMDADHTLGYRLMTHLNRLITSTMTAFAGG